MSDIEAGTHMCIPEPLHCPVPNYTHTHTQAVSNKPTLFQRRGTKWEGDWIAGVEAGVSLVSWLAAGVTRTMWGEKVGRKGSTDGGGQRGRKGWFGTLHPPSLLLSQRRPQMFFPKNKRNSLSSFPRLLLSVSVFPCHSLLFFLLLSPPSICYLSLIMSIYLNMELWGRMET